MRADLFIDCGDGAGHHQVWSDPYRQRQYSSQPQQAAGYRLGQRRIRADRRVDYQDERDHRENRCGVPPGDNTSHRGR